MNQGSLASRLRQNDKRFDRLEFDYRYFDSYECLDEIEYFLPNIVGAFEQNETVKYVSIGQEFMLNFSEDVLCVLFDAIARLPQLKEVSFVLRICQGNRPSLPVRAVTNLVMKSKGLVRLTLQNIRIFGKSEQIKEFGSAIQGHPALNKVILRNCHVDEVSVPEVVSASSSRQHSLSSDVSMTSEFVRQICSSSTIKTLHLERIHLSDDDVNGMVKSLKRNRTLRSLSLTSCRLNPKGAVELASILSCNKTLQVMCLNGTNIMDKGCIAIAKALKKNCITLKKLDVSYCGITELGHEALADMLRKNFFIDELKTTAVGQSALNIGALLLARRRILPLAKKRNTTTNKQWVNVLVSARNDVNHVFSMIYLEPSFLISSTQH